jgi:asparagine synthase (glutamine-hydrolysing)
VAARVFGGGGRGGGAGVVPPQTRWAKLPDMVERSRDPLAMYQLAYGLFLPDFYDELLSSAAVNGDGRLEWGLSPQLAQRLRLETAGHSPLSAISIMELRTFLGERLLRDSDAASMAASIELRLPLVDQVLVAQVSRVPDDLRYRPLGRKALLREAGLAGLDPALFDRPKSGFVLPFDAWIRKSLGREMDDTMRDPALAAAVGLRGDTVRRLWQSYQNG